MGHGGGHKGVLTRASRLLKKRMTTALLFSTRSSGGPAGDPRGVRLPADLRSSGPVRYPSYRLGREVSNPNEVVDGQGKEIGRASCRERVESSVWGVS